MPRDKKSDVKITLTKDNDNKKEMIFSVKGKNWLKMEIFTRPGNEMKEVRVYFKITPIEDDFLCNILACYKLKHSIKTLRVENKLTYVEKLKHWFVEREIEFVSDKECVIMFGTTIPAMVRLKSAVFFVMESIATSLLTGITERKKSKQIEENFKNWISETFSNGYIFQSIKERKEKT